MKVEKIIRTSEIDLSIEGVTLLTVEEAENAKEYIKEVDSSWWLRSPGLLYYTVALVKNNGFVRDYGTNVDSKNGVRPALKINLESTNMRIGDSFWFGGYAWTVISKKRALCDNIMERMPFRIVWKENDANVYETSDIKEWLDDWYKYISRKAEKTCKRKEKMRMTREEARQIIASWLASSKGEKEQCGYIEGWFYEKDVEAFHIAIEALQDRPQGKWIRRSSVGNWECSLCGSDVIATEQKFANYNYCHNCGARME